MLTEHDVEEYIDRHGMVHLLTMIENICFEKAEHVMTTWQDRGLASAWRRGSRQLYKAAQWEDWPL